jgi:cell division protein FtsX
VGSSDNENKLKDVSKAIFQSSATIDDELAKKSDGKNIVDYILKMQEVKSIRPR